MRRRILLALGCYVGALAVNRSIARVHGPSMRPTYRDRDVLLTVPARVPLREGRVVVVEDPTARGHLVVKRVHRVTASGVDVRGDAPGWSTDSRAWGPVPHAAVRRVVIARVGVPRSAARAAE